MCGISGFFARPGSALDVASLRASVAAIRHRGPDDEGFALFDPPRHAIAVASGQDTDPGLKLPPISAFTGEHWSIGLGHRRLSILDLTVAGHQPMSSPDRLRWIVFNGEIYNFLELQSDLEAQGVVFHTRSDTEVLLAAYRVWGEGMLVRLVGMFAFVIVDLEKGRAFAARDPFGIKPLYYAQTQSGLAFASEIKAVLCTPGVDRRVDPSELYRYLRFGMIDGLENTLFRDIRQLPAAQFLTFPLDRPQEARTCTYWSPSLLSESDLSFAEAAGELRDRFARSVRLHMRSDVPVGACLSGGVDSTAIVHFMREVAGPNHELHTFSFVTDDDPRISERPYVERVVQEVGAVSHMVSPRAHDLVNDFDTLILAQDQPFGSSSIYAQYRVFQLARDAGIKVVLDGQGSDEFFGGYPTAISAQLAALLVSGHWLDAHRLGRAGTFSLAGTRSRIVLSALARLLPPRLSAAIMPIIGESLMPSYLAADWFTDRSVPIAPRPQGRGINALRDELLLFTQHLSLPQLLRFEDRNSMHFSLESRVPFCVPDVGGFAFSLPPEYLVSGDGSTKAVLRKALEGLVPSQILDRPKIGFATPERQWLAALKPWVDEQAGRLSPDTTPFLADDGVRRLIDTQRGSTGAFDPALWRILSVARWAELFDARFE